MLMNMHKGLLLRDDIDGLYVLRKEGGKGHTSIENSSDVSIQELKKNINKSKERLIIAARSSIDNNKKINRTTKLGNRNGKKNNSIDISSDKLTRLNSQGRSSALTYTLV